MQHYLSPLRVCVKLQTTYYKNVEGFSDKIVLLLIKRQKKRVKGERERERNHSSDGLALQVLCTFCSHNVQKMQELKGVKESHYIENM